MKSNKKLGSYPGILITVSLTVALFLIGFCGWVAFSSKELIKYIKQNIEVQAYLDRNLSESKIDSIYQVIASFPEIEKNGDKSLISFISSKTAAENFLAETNESYEEILGDNPFRDAFNLKVKEELLTDGDLAILKQKIEAVSGVYEADYAKDFVNGITENANKAYLILSAIVLIFLVATILLINNTIKLALYSQRFIIRTMQLVGATNAFIQKPFISKGLLQGFIAGVIASALILITQQLALKQVDGLSLIQNQQMMIYVIIIMLILGPTIGLVSTFQSINKYLNVDLDDLY
ncbi:cell division protein FtsX [Arcticibacterium luteifluviistationis]|uniref:Cell division protein FtsX n=1 Tax=Arcticibacterium luteifluviistationis TaxID=1784714 RepID=A0A2Z4G818_9BACT|nr:permease-like cell division protein FtsX [Arcticibacterium luteifluviistationis]AWV97331.1 cell division protein [Arcticibacterium luteifluviistationis]